MFGWFGKNATASVAEEFLQGVTFVLLLAMLSLAGCRGRSAYPPPSVPTSAYPVAVDPAEVGKYPALSKSGGGYFYDDVLEYRVWVHHGRGDDSYNAFSTFEQALDFSKQTEGAEEPLVLVRQREWIDEPKPGQFIPKKGERVTEWQVGWLKKDKREQDSIDRFFAERRVTTSPAQTSTEATR